MDIAIISSTKDIASTNIKENLISNFKFNKLDEQFDRNSIFQLTINNKNGNSNEIIRLYTINSELIFTDDLDKKIDADVFIFISKHRAQEDRASLTCHAIGNFGNAEFGGKDGVLCYSNPELLKKLFIELDNNAKEPYEATLEATHHGPYMEKPVCFVELGSNEKYWKDNNGGFIVANSLVSALEKFDGFATMKNDALNQKNNKTDCSINSNNNKLKNDKINDNYNNKNLMERNNDYEPVFVIGGSHYNHIANKAMLQSNLAVGHICAKYNLENLDLNLIKQVIEKIIPKPKFALLDWKGLGKEKKRIVGLLEDNKIEYKRNDKVF
ncbi:hypothetical protein HYW19_00765 [Candidatus Woesearchaeota archaeon]|nr:hypothetical protein [Candidatus Woesearchaeota archaeon]